MHVTRACYITDSIVKPADRPKFRAAKFLRSFSINTQRDIGVGLHKQLIIKTNAQLKIQCLEKCFKRDRDRWVIRHHILNKWASACVVLNKRSVQVWVLDLFTEWLCCILLPWFGSTCPLRARGQCKSIRKLTILMKVVSFRMIMLHPQGSLSALNNKCWKKYLLSIISSVLCPSNDDFDCHRVCNWTNCDQLNTEDGIKRCVLLEFEVWQGHYRCCGWWWQ